MLELHSWYKRKYVFGFSSGLLSYCSQSVQTFVIAQYDETSELAFRSTIAAMIPSLE